MSKTTPQWWLHHGILTPLWWIHRWLGFLVYLEQAYEQVHFLAANRPRWKCLSNVLMTGESWLPDIFALAGFFVNTGESWLQGGEYTGKSWLHGGEYPGEPGCRKKDCGTMRYEGSKCWIMIQISSGNELVGQWGSGAVQQCFVVRQRGRKVVVMRSRGARGGEVRQMGNKIRQWAIESVDNWVRGSRWVSEILLQRGRGVGVSQWGEWGSWGVYQWVHRAIVSESVGMNRDSLTKRRS